MWKWVVVLIVVVVGAVAAAIGLSVSGGAGPGGDAGVAAGDKGGGAASGGFGFAGLFGGGAKDQSTPVQLTAATRGDLVRTVSAPGSIEPRTLVKISSQVSAKIVALPFREGDVVKAGDVVVRLDPQDLLAQLASAQASLTIEEARLDGSKADLINARLDFERVSQLHETGDAPKSELDTAEARYLQAQSQLKALEGSILVAKANIERVQKDIENTTITSPIDGTVTALNTEVGETAIVGTTNTPGSVIMEVADRSRMLLKAQVDETNIAPVKIGQTAKVFINAYDDRDYTGTVERIGLKRQVSTQGTGYFIIEIAMDLKEGETLLSGLSASTDIAVETLFDVIRVPSQAVLEARVDTLDDAIKDLPLVERDKTFTDIVYRFVEGEAVATPVKKGPSDLTHTAILEGVAPDERVVSGPFREMAGLTHKKKIRDEDADKEGDTEGDGAAEPALAAEEDAEQPGSSDAGADAEDDGAAGG